MYKKILKIILIIMTLVAILTSCKLMEHAVDKIETPVGDRCLETLVGCLEAHEYDEIEGIVEYDGSKDDFEAGIKNIDKFYSGEMTDYKKVGCHVNSHTSNGETTIRKDYTYEVETTEEVYLIAIVMAGNKDSMRITGININTKADEEALSTPAMVGTDIWQVIILVYSGLCILLIIFAIVLCIKSKVRLKWLWIIGMLFQSGISITVATNSFRFNVNVIYLGISRYLIYQNGTFVLTMVFPLVALLFIILRKYLIRSAERYSSKENNEDKSQMIEGEVKSIEDCADDK